MFGKRITVTIGSLLSVPALFTGMERGVCGIVVQNRIVGGEAKSRYLRKRSTPAEIILQEEIRNRKLGGLKFRRQYPVLDLILDFYFAEKSLGPE